MQKLMKKNCRFNLMDSVYVISFARKPVLHCYYEEKYKCYQ